MQWAKYKQGFTIVELLIVVVVIAILAAITIVAYTGIQNRAYDSAVQSDLKAMAQQIELFRINNNEQTPQISELPSLNLSVTKSAYAAPLYGVAPSNTANFLYCRPSVNTATFAIVARTKSGKVFVNGSNGPSQYTDDLSTATSGQSTCSRIGMPISGNTETDRTVLYNAGSWVSWVRG